MSKRYTLFNFNLASELKDHLRKVSSENYMDMTTYLNQLIAKDMKEYTIPTIQGDLNDGQKKGSN